MKKLPVFVIIVSIAIMVACGSSSTPDANQQAAAVADSSDSTESAGEWEVLFDGNSMEKWRGYRKGENEPVNWEVKDGMLTSSGGHGDLISKEEFREFDLEFDWKIAKAGNSGVMYYVAEEDYKEAYYTGPEYQIIDDEGYPRKLDSTRKSGANYAMQAPSSYPSKKVGEAFNTGRIVANKGHIEHYINGVKVVEYDLWTPEWENKVKETKFADMPGYGRFKEGHIALQDHGDQVWFKNIRIKRL